MKRSKRKRSARAKATDITPQVKQEVFLRDNGRCVVCGNMVNVMPNAHYIPRSAGGLGIPENIVTLCTNLTENKCHYKFDFGSKEEREEIGKIIENYLRSKYPDWNPANLIYKKYDF